MKGSFNNIRMVGVASMVPTKVVHNIDMIGQVDEKIVRKQILATGIESKHYVQNGQTAADLCIGAAKRLLEKLNWNPEEIKVLIYVSSYTLFVVPSTAFYIQDKLGIGTDCAVFDMNLACSGFVAGIQTLGALLSHGRLGDRGLLLTGVTPSMDADKAEQGTLSLFGDGGAAAAFEVCSDFYSAFTHNADGSRLEALIKCVPSESLYMDGMKVFNFTISDVADSINEFFETNDITRDDVDFFFLHQAQKFIIEKLMDFCDLPEKKCPMCVKGFGNTGAVTIPLNICYHVENMDFMGRKKLFMSGFGAGLSWANIYMETEDLCVLPVIYSDEKVEDC